ncbi:MAG: hypothetical protein AAF456_05175 [Planctomycetota bacterium]
MSFLIAGRKAFSGSNRKWWLALTEAVLAGAMVIGGLILLVVFITLAVLNWSEEGLYISIGYFALQLLLGTGLIVIGTYSVARIFWKVAASEERRGAIVSRAGEIELLNELGRKRSELPNVPSERYRPVRGQRLKFRIFPSRRNVWGFGSSAALTMLFVSVTVVLVLTSHAAWDRGNTGLLVGFLSVPIGLVAIWSVFNTFRRLLALTGVGPPRLEVSDFPFFPGGTYKFHLTQPARVRLRLLDVKLICQEEATFNEGTDVRTERQTVFERRLIRKRGLNLRAGAPHTEEFELRLPDRSMHSFKSPSNRVTWKIVVEASARGWPGQIRNFTIPVLPAHIEDSVPESTAKPQSINAGQSLQKNRGADS